MNKPPPKALPAQLPNLSEETIREMVAVQSAKVALEMKNAEIALRELDHNQKIADKSIQAQAEDRMDERRLARYVHTQKVWLAAGVLVLFFAFLVIAMWQDKDALALDLIKVVIGGIGGYGARAISEKKPSSEAKD